MFSSPEGNSNLRKHLLSSVLNVGEMEEEKSNKKKAVPPLLRGTKHGPLNFDSVAPRVTVGATRLAVIEYVFDEQLSFRTVECRAFQKLKESLVGRTVAGPFQHDIHDALDAEERRIQLVMKA